MSIRPGQSYRQYMAESEKPLKKAQLSYREQKEQESMQMQEEPAMIDNVERKLISWREKLNAVRAARKPALAANAGELKASVKTDEGDSK